MSYWILSPFVVTSVVIRVTKLSFLGKTEDGKAYLSQRTKRHRDKDLGGQREVTERQLSGTS